MRKITFVAAVIMLACFTLISACAGGGGAQNPLLSQSGVDVPDKTVILPPMPDRAENNATLAGICTTKTKVRDDVYRIIFSTYTSATKRNAAMVFAEVTRGIYLDPPKTRAEAKAIADAKVAIGDCLRLHSEISFKEHWYLMEGVTALHADTAARMEAYGKYLDLLNGQLFFSTKPTPDSCKGVLP